MAPEPWNFDKSLVAVFVNPQSEGTGKCSGREVWSKKEDSQFGR